MNPRSRFFGLSPLLALILLPTAAMADAGTPLMWIGFFHLFIGNAFIGILEGLLLGLLFRVKKLRAIGIMILANYFSTFVGMWIISGVRGWLQSPGVLNNPLHDVPRLLWVLALALFVSTIVLECPFCLWLLRPLAQKGSATLKRAIWASVAAQVLSYAILAPFYIMCSPITVFTKTHVDNSLSFAGKSNGVVYYIGTDGSIYRINVNGTNKRKVPAASFRDKNGRLFAAHSPKSGMRSMALLQEAEANIPGTDFNFGPARDLRPGNERDWDVSTGYWPVEGLAARNARTKQRYSIAFETPFLSWNCRNATVLPGDLVVFQLGNNIVVFDLNSRKIGLLAKGRGPVAGM